MDRRKINELAQRILAATVEVTDIGVAESIEAALGDARFALWVSPADHERTIKLARATTSRARCTPGLGRRRPNGPVPLTSLAALQRGSHPG